MELKSYQQEVIQDLSDFIAELDRTVNIQKAFTNFWIGNKFICISEKNVTFASQINNNCYGSLS
jgi:type III restriction enzyme